MADVFISYHEDSAGELAARIADTLESAGISCWYAKRDILPGDDFVQRIPLEISRCKIFLLILNENMSKSRHIENEVGLAFRRWNRYEEITILPLEIGDFKLKSWLDYYLIHAQSVKMPALDAERLRDLAQQVAKLLNREPTPTPPKVEPQPPTPKPQSPTPIPTPTTVRTPLTVPTPTIKVTPTPTPPPVKIIKRGKCGDNVTYTLDENGVLTISGKGSMWEFDWDRQTETRNTPWWYERETISHVKIENGVTTIERGAFDECAKLTSIEIPDSVTYIGWSAFFGCAGLTSVAIPDSVTKIGWLAFYGCENLKEVSVRAKTEIDDEAFPAHVRVERRA